jgi:uncharacterized RmlC-like cupin family protein
MQKKDFTQYLVDNPTPKIDKQTANRVATAWQLMGSAQVPESKYNIEMKWVTGIPEPDPQTDLRCHDYDEAVLFIGGDYRDPENLFAEIEFSLGNQKLRVNSTGAVFIPAGVPHGLINWKELTKPHVMISVGIGAGVSQSKKADGLLPSADYTKYQVKKPAHEVIAGTPVKGRQGPSSMTFVNNNLVAGSNIYIEGGWVFDMPEPNPHIFEHVHEYEEMVIHYGSDYKQPLELGAEIEFCVGGQPLKINKTSAVYVPSGVKHGPLTWKKYQYPHLEMAIMPGAGTLDEADPGGHREKARRNTKNG